MKKFILDEISLNWIHQFSKTRNIGMISAFRKAYELEKNLERTKQLQEKIEVNGLAFIKLKGFYIGWHGTTEEKAPPYEISFLLTGLDRDDGGKLKGLLKKMGREFNQDCILYKPFDKEDAVFIGTNDKDENEKPKWPGINSLASAGKFHPLRMGEFHTLMQGNPQQELMQKDSEMTPKKTLPSNPNAFKFESYERKMSFFEAWGDFLQKKLGNSTLSKEI
jgi:hypothetical protein